MKIYLDHIGIACDNLDEGSKFWNLIGLTQGDDELVEDQGVVTRFSLHHQMTLLLRKLSS